MSKREKNQPKDVYKYPSRFGSHSSMIVEDLGDKVLCQDEHGNYTTEKNRLDTNLADPYRFSLDKRGVKTCDDKKTNLK